jgi:uncharacterized membrane protein
VELFYKDQLIGSVSGAGKLKKGVMLKDDVLNRIELKLSEKPMMLDLIIDGYHSPVNQSHPRKEIKGTSTFFWIISVLSLVVGLVEVGALTGFGAIQVIVLVINLLIVAAYIIAAIFVGRGHIWAYYLGFILFSLLFVFNLVFTPLNLWGMIFLVMRGAALGVLIYNLKTVVSAQKHACYGKYANEELLDS